MFINESGKILFIKTSYLQNGLKELNFEFSEFGAKSRGSGSSGDRKWADLVILFDYYSLYRPPPLHLHPDQRDPALGF